MTPRIKKPEALTLEQRLEAAKLLKEQADQMQDDLDSMTKAKLGPNGEVIHDGRILSALDMRRLRQDIIDRRLEAITLEGSVQDNDLAQLRRQITQLRRRNEQLEQIVKLHGLTLPGYPERDPLPPAPPIEAPAPPAPPTKTAPAPPTKPRGKAAKAGGRPDVYEPRTNGIG